VLWSKNREVLRAQGRAHLSRPSWPICNDLPLGDGAAESPCSTIPAAQATNRHLNGCNYQLKLLVLVIFRGFYKN